MSQITSPIGCITAENHSVKGGGSASSFLLTDQSVITVFHKNHSQSLYVSNIAANYKLAGILSKGIADMKELTERAQITSKTVQKQLDVNQQQLNAAAEQMARARLLMQNRVTQK